MSEIKQKHYRKVRKMYEGVVKAAEKLGEEVKKAGPIKGKEAELIQLAAALANRSEGAVHSHTKRALEAGATQEELYHAAILLTNTIGFSAVMAGITWISDIAEK